VQSSTQGVGGEAGLYAYKLLFLLLQGLQTCTFVLAMELFTPKMRTFVGAGMELFWGVGVMYLALLAWLIRDWRYIQLAISLPSVLSVTYLW
jgi:hypothetical protein